MTDSTDDLHASKEGGTEIGSIVERNIRALVRVRRELEGRTSREERVAEAVTRFAGSMAFVYLHAALFGGWILLNTGVVPGVRPFDPFPFVMLAMFASVEAIFLSTFVLISQNRMASTSERRAELDLQINLLAEHEITRLIQLVDGIATKLGVSDSGPSLDELKRDVAPDRVLEYIDNVQLADAASSPPARDSPKAK